MRTLVFSKKAPSRFAHKILQRRIAAFDDHLLDFSCAVSAELRRFPILGEQWQATACSIVEPLYQSMTTALRWRLDS